MPPRVRTQVLVVSLTQNQTPDSFFDRGAPSNHAALFPDIFTLLGKGSL